MAELIECPSAGFWGHQGAEQSPTDLSPEGQERQSRYCCYKSHLSWPELTRTPQHGTVIPIYILRDPRDVVVSGGHYFSWNHAKEQWIEPYQNSDILPAINPVRVYPKAFRGRQNDRLNAAGLSDTQLFEVFIEPVLHAFEYRSSVMLNTVVYGNEQIHEWLSVPWKEHVQGYLEQDCLIVQYESLWHSPETICRRILSQLGIERSDTQIQTAIERQAFSTRKVQAQAQNNQRTLNFLREGTPEQWRYRLYPEQVHWLQEHLAPELSYWGYPLLSQKA